MLEGILLFLILMMPILLNKNLRTLFMLALFGGRALLLFTHTKGLEIYKLKGDSPAYEPQGRDDLMYDGDESCFYAFGKAQIAAATDFFARLLSYEDLAFLEATADMDDKEFKKLVTSIVEAKQKGGEVRVQAETAGKNVTVGNLIPFHRLKIIYEDKDQPIISPQSHKAFYDFVRARILKEREKENLKFIATIAFAAFLVLVGFAMVLSMMQGGGGQQLVQGAQQVVGQGVKP